MAGIKWNAFVLVGFVAAASFAIAEAVEDVSCMSLQIDLIDAYEEGMGYPYTSYIYDEEEDEDDAEMMLESNVDMFVEELKDGSQGVLSRVKALCGQYRDKSCKGELRKSGSSVKRDYEEIIFTRMLCDHYDIRH